MMGLSWLHPRRQFHSPGQSVIDGLRADLAAERDRYERLVERLAEMQREGFHPPAAPGGEQEQPVDLPAAVEQALEVIDPLGRDLETRRWAVRQIQLGTAETEVVAAIRQGSAAEWDAYV